jgi:hypothetical protein
MFLKLAEIERRCLGKEGGGSREIKKRRMEQGEEK